MLRCKMNPRMRIPAHRRACAGTVALFRNSYPPIAPGY
jgi:hypothetical protein